MNDRQGRVFDRLARSWRWHKANLPLRQNFTSAFGIGSAVRRVMSYRGSFEFDSWQVERSFIWNSEV